MRTNTDLKGLKGAVREFVKTLPKGAVALVFYAGHGVQVKGQNYLIPVDAQMAEEFEVPDETLSMDSLMNGLEQAGTSLNILILDCCRDDPYSRSWRGARSAAGSGGLVMPADMPQGMFIAFSTSPGRTAEDGDGKNSTYSAALARELLTPGMDFEKVFKSVGAQVAKATGGHQEPWVNTKFYGSFVFKAIGGESISTLKENPSVSASTPLPSSASTSSDAPYPYAIAVPGNPLVVTLPGANASLGHISIEKYDSSGNPTGVPLMRNTQVQIPDPKNPEKKIYFKIP